MIDTRPWARRRQTLVLGLLGLVGIALVLWVYVATIFVPPSCFDGKQNGNERGVDCGGSCALICAIDIRKPQILWTQAFKIVDGQYNVVAYIENANRFAATPELPYTMKLSDANGVIVERSGTTVLPPNSNIPIFEGRVLTGERVPTGVEIVLGTATVWAPIEAVGDQFTLVDRGAMVRADSAPVLRSTLRNNTLDAVEDVEVVVTIYDAEGQPLTASRTFADFVPRSTTEVTFTWPEPIAKTLRSCEVPTDVVVAIDLSGSMNELGGVPPEPITSVKRAAESFVTRLGERDRVSVVTFASDAEMVVPLSPQPATKAATISQLVIAPEEETGSTNSGAALELALAEFQSDRHNLDARKVLVLLTDGLTNAPKDNPEEFALTQAARLKQDDVTIYTIGLGENINAEFLAQVASTPADFYRTLTVSQVDQIYRTITDAICEQGAARIDIVPKAPLSF